MYKALILLVLAFQLFNNLSLAADVGESGLVGYVNTLQGTNSSFAQSHGNTLPLSGVPWGMTNWSVENESGSWFFKPNGKIDGFRATRQPSPWIGDYGQLVLMPQAGDLKWKAKERLTDYDQTTAIFRPDYQKLDIQQKRIISELTATERCAVLRFTYQSESGRLLVNAAGKSEIQIDGRTIRGVSRANHGGVPDNFASYFVIELDRDIAGSSLLSHDQVVTGASAKGDDVIACLEFKTGPGNPVVVKVGTSLISWEQAERNLQTEVAGDFDAVHAQVAKLWNANLGLAEIDATDEQKKTFYSCFYRAQMFPHRLYEQDEMGKPVHYSPYDGKVHEGVLYGDIGIWDGFRTTFPLLTLLFPEQNQEILQGFVNAAIEGGAIPEWPSPGYRDCMIGQHSAAIFADAIAKGQANFDVAKAYDFLRRVAFFPPKPGELVRKGMTEYLKLGYVPIGACSYEMSATLDYAYDDWCVAQVAKTLGQNGDYAKLMERSKNYRLLWDPETGFMRAKDAQGKWVEPFDPFLWGGPYAESGPWQSSWFVPQDPYGLQELIGGKAKLAAKMDEMLSLPPTYHYGKGGYGGVIHEMREMGVAKFGQYAQSNQPSFSNLYWFSIAGQPWKTEYWTRQVCQSPEMFSSGEDGFSGDEDNGSMASWYLFNAMGFYPFCPGNPTYILTSPLFKKLVLHLPRGKTFVINAAANNEQNLYVQSRQLNGANYTCTWISHDDLVKGGQLDVQLGPEPAVREVTGRDLPVVVAP